MTREDALKIYEGYKDSLSKSVESQRYPIEVFREFEKVPESLLVEEDYDDIGGKGYGDIGLSKYIKRLGDGFEIYIIIGHYDRCKTNEIRPDGNSICIRLLGTLEKYHKLFTEKTR